MRLHRLALLVAPVALAALLGTAPAASAGIKSNSATPNALHPNALTSNALATTGAALDDLDGVQVEAVVLPAAE
jgi:hypothetical protein